MMNQWHGIGMANEHEPRTNKWWIHVNAEERGDPQRVCWYTGTSDMMVEKAVRLLLQVPRSVGFLLRDGDGDLVPVSARLPHDSTYTLVVMNDAQGGTVGHCVDALDSSSDCSSAPLCEMHADAHRGRAPSSSRKRPRRQLLPSTANGDTVTPNAIAMLPLHQTVSSLPLCSRQGLGGQGQGRVTASQPVPVPVPPVPRMRPHSVARLITRFLEVFTRAIANDDNVSFIPSRGPFALYAVYCALFQDPRHHPKNQDAFYKITSTQGKVDRQRVIRYYQQRAAGSHSNGDTSVSSSSTSPSSASSSSLARGAQAMNEFICVVCKPVGKGSLLRKYVHVPADCSRETLVQSAGFVALLDLDPNEVVAQYLVRIDGFRAISKDEYYAHRHAVAS